MYRGRFIHVDSLWAPDERYSNAESPFHAAAKVPNPLVSNSARPQIDAFQAAFNLSSKFCALNNSNMND